MLEQLLSGGPPTYVFLFAVLMVVFTLIIFKISKASKEGLATSFVISVLLTASAFYVVNPGYGMVILFYLAIGLGGMAFLYFSKNSWSGFAASILVGLIVLAMYMYDLNHAYGLTIVIIGVVAIVICVGLMVIVYSLKQGYGHRKPDVVTMTMTDPRTGRTLTATAKRGAFTGPTANDQSRETPLLATFVSDAVALFPDTQERARFLVSQPDVEQLMPYVDGETKKEVLLLQSGKRASRRK